MNDTNPKWPNILTMQMKALLFGFFITLFSSQALSDNTNKLLQDELDELKNHYKFTGVSLTIIAPRISPIPMTFMSGSTQEDSGRPIITSDYFQIGSNTKSFIAALLVKLQSKGVLSLNDPITNLLGNYPNWRKVKIINLLQNNSGIPSYSGPSSKFFELFESDPSHEFSQEDLVSYAYNYQDENKKPIILQFQPGHGWFYSNTNWVLAGMIAEKATGRSLNDLLEEYFLSPDALNLSNTIYHPTKYNEQIMQRLVHGYTDAGKDVTYRDMSWTHAAGGMLASSEDLAYWAYYLFHAKALTPAELAQMEHLVSNTTGLPVEGNQPGYALGIGLKENKAGWFWGHEGHTEGYHSMFSYFPEDDITIAVNAGGLKESDFSAFSEDIMVILKKAQRTN